LSTKDLFKSAVDLVARSDLKDVAVELGEHGFDAFLDEGTLKDVPLIGTLAKLASAGRQIRDRLFANKLRRFIERVAELPEDEREKLIAKVDEDPESKQRLGEHLLTILDRLDDSLKAEVIAVAFVEFLREEIDRDTLERVSVAVDRCHIRDLRRLNTSDLSTRYPPEVATKLSSAGLLEIGTVPTVRGPGAQNEYITTPLGQRIRALLDEHFKDAAQHL
jgi:hypothetical protein